MIESVPTNMQSAHMGLVALSEEGNTIMSYFDDCVEDLKQRLVCSHQDHVPQLQGAIKAIQGIQEQMKAAGNKR